MSTFNLLKSLPPWDDNGPFPNLGPKLNHCFGKNKAGFTEAEHPRWGICQSVITDFPVKANEEIFVNYGYKGQLPFPSDMPWYWNAKKKYETELAKKKDALKN